MGSLRRFLVAVGVVFCLVFAVPSAIHRLVCEPPLGFASCPNSPHYLLVELFAAHRNVFILFVFGYLVAVGVVFRAELRNELAWGNRRVVGYALLLPVVLAVGIYVLLLA